MKSAKNFLNSLINIFRFNIFYFSSLHPFLHFQQKSANYTCVSTNTVGKVLKSVYVYVIDRGTIELCMNETSFGIDWPTSPPGTPILSKCPKGYIGQSERTCELRDIGKIVWFTPDFSDCLAETLVDVYDEVIAVIQKSTKHF